MLYTQKIQRAIKFASKTHQVYRDQKRKGKAIPYITHPLAVGLILSLAGGSEDVISAGILHDTIEDSPEDKKVTREMIAERFGEEVAKLVESVTERDRTLPWEERKEEAVGNIANFSHDCLLVKSADVLSNTTELVDDYARFGDEIFERFSVSKEKTLRHYLRVIETLLACWQENPLAQDLEKVSQELERIKSSF